MKKLNVLIACEESQAVCKEFRKLGHNAFSCDIEPCSGGHPEWHKQGDVLPMLNGNISFRTQDGELHNQLGQWDLIIAHPPCTYLTGAGAANIPKDPSRIPKGFEAAEFFIEILNAKCKHIVVENPPPMKRFNLPQYSQIIQPFEHGDPVSKRTCLWIKGLPLIYPTNNLGKESVKMQYWTRKATGKTYSCSKWYNDCAKLPPKERAKARSKTFPGIAKALATQYSEYLTSEVQNEKHI